MRPSWMIRRSIGVSFVSGQREKCAHPGPALCTSQEALSWSPARGCLLPLRRCRIQGQRQIYNPQASATSEAPPIFMGVSAQWSPAGAQSPMSCWHQSTACSPRGWARPICKRPKHCWRSWRDNASMHSTSLQQFTQHGHHDTWRGVIPIPFLVTGMKRGCRKTQIPLDAWGKLWSHGRMAVGPCEDA